MNLKIRHFITKYHKEILQSIDKTSIEQSIDNPDLFLSFVDMMKACNTVNQVCSWGVLYIR